MSARTHHGDLAGAKTRIKALEVAWDDAEAGLKPRDPSHWHELDGRIDDALSALRADRPNRTTSTTAVDALRGTLARFDGRITA